MTTMLLLVSVANFDIFQKLKLVPIFDSNHWKLNIFCGFFGEYYQIGFFLSLKLGNTAIRPFGSVAANGNAA